MVILTDLEMNSVFGGGQKEVQELVKEANLHGSSWTDEQWDEWSKKFEEACN